MQAIEFETIAHGHTIRIPDSVPDGVQLRVLVLLDATPPTPKPPDDSPESQALKTLLMSLSEALSDEDLARPKDFGREIPEWDT